MAPRISDRWLSKNVEPNQGDSPHFARSDEVLLQAVIRDASRIMFESSPTLMTPKQNVAYF
jgi:hypothetical protein